MKKKLYIMSLLLACFYFGCGKKTPTFTEDVFSGSSSQGQEDAKEGSEEKSPEEVSTEGQVCYVYVCGEVNAPGVYRLPAGSRVYEAIQMAGGLTETAEASTVNQALLVEDGQMIQVLAPGEAPATGDGGAGAAGGEESDGKVDLNTADVDELMEIPGIGEAKARSILAYRSEHGGFRSTEDVMNITGIKEGLYAKMKDYITVR